jgi:hypothetical protein
MAVVHSIQCSREDSIMSVVRALASATLALLCGAAAHGQPSFTLTDIGDLPGGSNKSWAADINNLGHVVGASQALTATTSDLGWRPFVWTPAAGIKRLTAPAGLGVGAGATGINDSDVIGGYNGCTSCDPVSAYSGWRWQGNLLTGSGTVSAATNVNVERGINNSGQAAGWLVIGSYTNPAAQTSQAYRYTPGSPATSTNLGHLPGGTTSGGWGINAIGNVVGSAVSSVGAQPFIYTDASGMQALTATARGTAYAINDSNQVVGQLVTAAGAGNGQAFLWTAADGMTTLGAANWKPEAINNAGWVVGCSWGGSNCVNRNGSTGYLWTPGDGLLNLFDLIAPSDPLRSGLVINNVPGINDLGQIVINGTRAGVQHAYLLTPLAAPVPEPSAMLLMAAGLLVVAGLRRRTS